MLIAPVRQALGVVVSEPVAEGLAEVALIAYGLQVLVSVIKGLAVRPDVVDGEAFREQLAESGNAALSTLLAAVRPARCPFVDALSGVFIQGRHRLDHNVEVFECPPNGTYCVEGERAGPSSVACLCLSAT